MGSDRVYVILLIFLCVFSISSGLQNLTAPRNPPPPDPAELTSSSTDRFPPTLGPALSSSSTERASSTRGPALTSPSTEEQSLHKLPNYIGCFDTWLSEEPRNQYEIQTNNGKYSCITESGESLLPDLNDVLILIRDWHSICTPRDRRSYGLHDLIQVSEENCDLKCKKHHQCGGTFAYSVFSVPANDILTSNSTTIETTSTMRTETTLTAKLDSGTTEITSTTRQSGISTSETPEAPGQQPPPIIGAGAPQPSPGGGILRAKTGRLDLTKLQLNNTTDIYKNDLKKEQEIHLQLEERCATCVNFQSPTCLHQYGGKGPDENFRYASATYQYGFNNSPLNCVNYCRRYLHQFLKHENTVRKSKSNVAINTDEQFAVLGYVNSSLINYPFCSCFTRGRKALQSIYNRTWEASCNSICPGNPNFYCGAAARYAELNEGHPLDTIYKIPLKSSEDSENKEPTFTPLVPVVLTDWKKCKDYDQYNKLWEAYPGTLASQPCPTLHPPGKLATWECLGNGKFREEGVNYEECSSKWLADLSNEIPRNESLNIWNATDWIIRLQNNTKRAKELNNYDSKYFGYEVNKIIEIIHTVFANVTGADYLQMKNMTVSGIQSIDNMLTNFEPWSQLSSTNRTMKATETLQTLEFVLLQMFSKSIQYENSFDTVDLPPFAVNDTELLAIEAFAGKVDFDQRAINNFSFPFACEGKSGKSCISIPSDMIDKNSSKTIIYTAAKIRSEFVFDKLPAKLNGISGTEAKVKVLNGPTLLFSLYDSNNGSKIPAISNPENRISLTFEHDIAAAGRSTKLKRRQYANEKPKAVYNSSVCVFWHETYLIWSTEGCELFETSATTSICQCNHFTYFSVLMSVTKYEGKDKGLKMLTIVLASGSALTLIISVITFYTEINPSRKAIITKHLSVVLLLANIALLMIVDKNFLELEDPVCSAAAAVTMYLFLTAITLMGAEGFIAYQAVVLLFDGSKITMWKLLAVVYCIPFPIVLTTWITSLSLKQTAFGGDEFCWLQDYYVWSFLVPVIIVFGGNTIVIGLVVRAAYHSQRKMVQLQLRFTDLRLRLRGLLGLSVICGISWFLGFLILIPDSTASIAMEYLFTIFNASQGILVSIFHCFAIKKYRKYMVQKVIPCKTKSTELSSNKSKRTAPNKSTNACSVEDVKSNTKV